MKNCLIIAGEKSGEDHGMSFLPELMRKRSDVHFFGVGGERFKSLNVELLYHSRDFSGIGISEIVSKIPFYYKAMARILDEVKKRNVKTAILIDFQGFNLKLAKKLKALGVDVLYYVAPQAWVWKPWRAKVLEKNIHTLFTILPFEKKWFKDRGVTNVKSVIHPLMFEYHEEIKNLRSRSFEDFSQRKLRVLLLPGSRNTEVETLLPIFKRALELIDEKEVSYEIGLVTTETVRAQLYEPIVGGHKVWKASDLAKAVDWADIAIAASGTVTLATGLLKLPTIVCYKISLVTEFILGLFITYKGPVSLTNIILDEKIFPELIQHHCDRYNISQELFNLTKDKKTFEAVLKNLEGVAEGLTGDDFCVPTYMAEVMK